MPWNDLYFSARHLAPGVMCLPIVIRFTLFLFIKVKVSACRNVQRKYIDSNPLGSFFYLWRLYQLASRRNRKLLIHIHNPLLAYIGLFAKLVLPNILIAGNLHTDWSFLLFRHRVAMCLLACISDLFISVSQSSEDSIPHSLKRRLSQSGRLKVIHNGIDVKISSGAKIKAPRVSEEVVAVVAARMAAPKNHSFILQLIADTPQIDRLIWFGDGELRAAVEAEIDRLRIGSRVELRGRCAREEVLCALSEATIYLSASKWEGIGVANLEAAAAGCWLFLSKIPPHDEIARMIGVNTFSLSRKEDWQRGVIDYISKPNAEKERMTQAIALKTRELFDLQDSVGRYLAAYRALLSPNTGKGR